VSDVNEELVRRYFELQGYFVRTNLKYEFRTANGMGWSDVDLCILHPLTGDGTVVVRMNGVDTPWCYRDISIVVGPVGSRLDCVMVPKVEHASHIHFVESPAHEAGSRAALTAPIGNGAQIESPRGLVEIVIAAASPRLETLIFGPGDYAAALGVPQLTVGLLELDSRAINGTTHSRALRPQPMHSGSRRSAGRTRRSTTSMASARRPDARICSASTANGRSTQARSARATRRSRLRRRPTTARSGSSPPTGRSPTSTGWAPRCSRAR
jgi:hypothetical protein